VVLRVEGSPDPSLFDANPAHGLLIVFPAGFLQRDERIVGRGLNFAVRVRRAGYDAVFARLGIAPVFPAWNPLL
jgi:hypothetical protein